MPLISIIIPVYNAETTLSDCLDSISAQSYRNWEAICIDDGSNDRSLEILQKYQKNDSRFKVFHQSNNGVSSARNNALRHVAKESEWIHFVDSDDFIAPTMYEDIFDAIYKQNDPSIDYVRLFGQKTDKHYSETAFSKIANPHESVLLTQKEYFLSNKIGGLICNLFIKKEIAIQHEFDESIHLLEDQLYSIACALDSKKILFFHKPNYFYYQNPNSLSHRINRDKSESIIRVTNNIISLGEGGGKEIFNYYLNKFYIPAKANMAVRAKLSYCLKARKTPSSLPKAFNNGIKLLSVLTKKNKIAYLALNFLSRIHKNDRNQ